MQKRLGRKTKKRFCHIHIKLNNLTYKKRYQRDRLHLKCEDLTTRMKENFMGTTKSIKYFSRQV